LQASRQAAHTLYRIVYGRAVDVDRATDLYARGCTLRQIGAELGVSRTTVSERLRLAGEATLLFASTGICGP
jgi:hypothetical protein